MRQLCEMTCVVSIAHKNSLNGSLSYFYLPKEIEVGEGIDSRVMELGSSPILPVRAVCFWVGYLGFGFSICKRRIQIFPSQHG